MPVVELLRGPQRQLIHPPRSAGPVRQPPAQRPGTSGAGQWSCYRCRRRPDRGIRPMTTSPPTTPTAPRPARRFETVGHYAAFGAGDGRPPVADRRGRRPEHPGRSASSSVPQRRGHQAVLHYFRRVAELDRYTFEPTARYTPTATGWSSLLHLAFTHRAPASRPSWTRSTASRCGRAVHYRPYCDTAAFIEVFALCARAPASPTSPPAAHRPIPRWRQWRVEGAPDRAAGLVVARVRRRRRVRPQTTVRAALLAADLAAEVGDERPVADAFYGGLVRHIGCTGYRGQEASPLRRRRRRRLRRHDGHGRLRPAGRRSGASTPGFARTPAPRSGRRPSATSWATARRRGRPPAAQCDAGERLAALLPPVPGARLVPTGRSSGGTAPGPASLAGDAIALVTRVVEVLVPGGALPEPGGASTALARSTPGRRQLDPDLVRDHRAFLVDRLRALGDPGLAVGPGARRRPARDHPLGAQVEQVALAFGRFQRPEVTLVHRARRARGGWRRPPPPSRAWRPTRCPGSGCGARPRPRRWASPPARGRCPDRSAVLSGTDRPARLGDGRICGATPLLADVATLSPAPPRAPRRLGLPPGLRASGARRAGPACSPVADVAAAHCRGPAHRPALDPVRRRTSSPPRWPDGRLDREAVERGAGGCGRRRPVPWPSGLSDREVEVVRLVAPAPRTRMSPTRHLGQTWPTTSPTSTTRSAPALRAAPRCSRWSTALLGPGAAEG